MAVVILLGLTAGNLPGPELGVHPELDGLDIDVRQKRSYRVDRYVFPKGMASGNRLHTERAPLGSDVEAQRIAEAADKRAAKLARRAARAQSIKGSEHG